MGSKSGRRSIDGKRYVEYIVPRQAQFDMHFNQSRMRVQKSREVLTAVCPGRRTVPYPFSIGGVIHMLFFAAEDPSNPKHFIKQMLRSLTVISVIVVLTQTYITESMYHASVLYDRLDVLPLIFTYVSWGEYHASVRSPRLVETGANTPMLCQCSHTMSIERQGARHADGGRRRKSGGAIHPRHQAGVMI